MIWVKFDNLDDFNKWHETIKVQLGLPKISVDVEGNPQPDAIETTDYVQPMIVSPTDIRALIDDIYNEGLEISENPIVSNYDQADA